jgi:hypothetical protein
MRSDLPRSDLMRSDLFGSDLMRSDPMGSDPGQAYGTDEFGRVGQSNLSNAVDSPTGHVT